MNVIIKALIITGLIFLANLSIIIYLENSRDSQILNQLNQNEATQIDSKVALQLLEKTLNQKDYCELLLHQVQNQTDKLYPLFNQLEDAKNAALLNQYDQAKQSFLVNNLELYSQQSTLIEKCPQYNYPRILYFYPENTVCTDCKIQADILTELTAQCPKLRVFAIPTDSEFLSVKALMKIYDITHTPTIIINDKTKIEQVKSKDELQKMLNNC